MNKIVLPKLGQTMEEAVLESWRVNEGDTVASGDIIAEITTDKATLEVQSFHDGTVRKILAAEGETVPVNALIALIGAPDEEIPEGCSRQRPRLDPRPRSAKRNPSRRSAPWRRSLTRPPLLCPQRRRPDTSS